MHSILPFAGPMSTSFSDSIKAQFQANVPTGMLARVPLDSLNIVQTAQDPNNLNAVVEVIGAADPAPGGGVHMFGVTSVNVMQPDNFTPDVQVHEFVHIIQDQSDSSLTFKTPPAFTQEQLEADKYLPYEYGSTVVPNYGGPQGQPGYDQQMQSNLDGLNSLRASGGGLMDLTTEQQASVMSDYKVYSDNFIAKVNNGTVTAEDATTYNNVSDAYSPYYNELVNLPRAPGIVPASQYASADESILSGGLTSTSVSGTDIVSAGLQDGADAALPVPNIYEQVSSPPMSQDLAAQIASDSVISPTSSSNGNIAQPYFAPLSQDDTALPTGFSKSDINSAQSSLSPKVDLYGDMSYTGSNLKVMLEVANTSQTGAGTSVRISRQITELTTITVSVHRVKSPAPAMGYINSKGWARGRRTVAGTMVLTQLSTDILSTFLLSSAFTSDLSKDSQYVKVDQLPPFNLSMMFADEYGHMSYQRILGVEFVTSGNVYSIQDMLSEQTVSYVAADFTPLLPYSKNDPFLKSLSSRTQTQKTVESVLIAARTPTTLAVQTQDLTALLS